MLQNSIKKIQIRLTLSSLRKINNIASQFGHCFLRYELIFANNFRPFIVWIVAIVTLSTK